MKECLNCKSKVREDDTYCRNCGCLLQSNKNYIITNVIMLLNVMGIIFIIIMVLATYMLEK